MSENNDDLELRALERQLDDAFETTRPRPSLEDELWTRIQSSRPAPRRLRDALAAFWAGVRAVPAVPATAVALVLIVALGVGIVTLSGRGGGGAATSSESTAVNQEAAGQFSAGTFGRLPAPGFGNAPKSGGAAAGPATPSLALGSQYAGPVRYEWTGSFVLNVTTAPVFRYGEPATADADQFAAALGAVLRGRPSGFLGSYSAVDYTLKIRGTVQSPPSSPVYFIFAGLNMPEQDVAGGPQEAADVFLAQHNLTPPWPHTVEVDTSSDPAKVVYQRQFDVPGYGPAYVVNGDGSRYGMEVDVSANRPVLASGMLPLSMDVANYNVVSAEDAIRAATSASAPAAAGIPTMELNHAELVYVLVPAGSHSFYEPAFLFTGEMQNSGKSYAGRVLVSAVDPTQRTR
jgi:hypothetical protein